MKDKKILQEEILSDKELNGVAGGTVRESWEIFQVLNKKNAPSMGLYDMPGYLKKNFNIDAKIDGRPDWDEGDANIYSRNGETLTHKQVLDIIKNS